MKITKPSLDQYQQETLLCQLWKICYFRELWGDNFRNYMPDIIFDKTFNNKKRHHVICY